MDKDTTKKTPTLKVAQTTQARPGRQTSEFWVTAAVGLILLLAAIAGYAFGALDWEKAMTLLAIGLPALGVGYSASRGLAKLGPPKALLPLAIGVSLAMGACGPGTFKAALDGAHRGIKVVSTVYEPALQAECLEKARACKGKVKKVEECTPYLSCRDVQRQLASAMVTTHRGIAAAEKARRAAVALGLLKGGE